ncbi:chemotaxis response regulator protein-glutamate methylesterase [Tabrizicola sp. TH137]|uniref:protein-glutamate methylesterase/protein-glutamine glutaminase n=1 Tax=Tabrizicola sp. TH137 TaxID=2067452 RepID=UPI000C7CE308|nr:chemotaxis response regulator protein-glutamate methylesterase [Tabrizicola sp. TH137]PLL10878.1 chemotaxis response regulator protein-glutamate methylesterase [Tabrizicola sp. TH137]
MPPSPTFRRTGRTRVLIVDDSAAVRQTLADIIGSDPELEVMGTASDPFQAAQRIREERPDVITLDIEMPRMDGITFLRKLMAQNPIPVVICSSLVGDGSESLGQVLAAGAVDIICKPQLGTKAFLEDSRIRICTTIKAAAQARLSALRRLEVEPKLTADAVLPAPVIRSPVGRAMARTTETVVAVGASTGGTEALRILLQSMPLDCPPLVIVQHMPESFTAAFARRLDTECGITVREAQSGDRLLRGHALIAPGNRHMLLRRSGASYLVDVRDGPLVSRHRPSCDVLFRSVAQHAGSNAIGVIMTGMGDDGARGLKEMRDAGARTLGQDEATCVVFGMPKEAHRHGAVEELLPLHQIGPAIQRLATRAL